MSEVIDDQRANLSPAAKEFVSGPLKMLIDGEWVDSQTGRTIAVSDPATGKEITTVPAGSSADVDRAVAAARRAFEGSWAAVRPVQRERMLLKLADLLEAAADEFAELETLDNGKILMMSRHADLNLAIDSLRYMAGAATKIEGTTIDPSFAYVPDMRFTSYTLREPVGVVGQIIPWNFPLVMAVWKIAPALAAGCTVVLKPAEDTPITALRLGQLIAEAGIPDGVVNIITGDAEPGQALVDHPDVDKIAFTGSTEVGKIIQQRAAGTMKRLSLELGGKSPVVILKDADVNMAIQGAAQAIFFNHGQVCTAGSRLFVDRSIYDAVVDGLAQVADGFKLGSGFDPEVQMGPLVSATQRSRVQSYLDKGTSEGGRLVTGGEKIDGPGHFLRPAVFADVTPEMTIYREEIFGPVLASTPFDDPAEALKLANDTSYGLGASIWTNDLQQANRFIRGMKAGSVWVNAHNLLDPAVPFGGYRMSGYGRELGHAVRDLYTESKSVTMMI
ncbi:aldehyde dehydrogenase family protein [Croceicoccus gelatinilyticus]|uniref:aldehyde dehydrogenase family protein n=1 Tax=Croceicoccus gelatinilyticus TaxID=2835536 RepID=UPI001BCC1CAD|nr:aldehyde dehydrogenase family protein [Croceicoccus gelatinilyticus]MBS7669412.1 aldehyde dehydrogenase family protein [Croceicoccus gelatinilyticus]